MNCADCDPCGSTRVGFAAGGGEPGGTLPDGDTGDFLQWNGTLWVPSAWTLPLATNQNDLGEVLTVTAAGASQFQPLFQRKSPLMIGARQISATFIWLVAWQFDTAALTTVGAAGFLVPPVSGRLRNMRVLHATPVVSTDNITYTLVMNQVTNTALAVTINTGTAKASNLVDVVDVGSADLLSIRADGATATRLLRTCVSFDFEY